MNFPHFRISHARAFSFFIARLIVILKTGDSSMSKNEKSSDFTGFGG
jgi:hypothetical protein